MSAEATTPAAPVASRVPVGPGWVRGYRRAWLRADLVAGVIVGSVVIPQAVAYAQIAGLPPEAGLMAAPGALVAYALLGTSRSLVVSATTATAALSASAVGSLAGGDTARYATLSAALAIVTAAAVAAAGALGLGRVTDFVSKPVMTGFLFGLGLTVAIGQVPKLLGVPGGSGHFFAQAWTVLGELSDTSAWTVGVGLASVAGLVALRRYAPRVPGSLLVLVLATAGTALFDLAAHGVDVVGELPAAYPRIAWPDVSLHVVGELTGAALGISLVMSAEAIGVARSLAARHGYTIDANRELVALGGSNFLAGISSGFVQSGGASQTVAAEQAGGTTQLSSVVAAALIVVTGAFLTGLFKNLPQATLGAIVIVAISSFFRVDELRRFARLRRSAIVLSLIALVGVLLFGVLAGLVIAAVLSLIAVIKRISNPSVGTLGRNPEAGVWVRTDRHERWQTAPGVVVTRVDGPLFYANAAVVKERLAAIALTPSPRPAVLVLELGESADLDVETVDAFGDLASQLEREGVELRLASVRAKALRMLRRSGLAARLEIAPSIDAAVGRSVRGGLLGGEQADADEVGGMDPGVRDQ